MAIVCCPVLTLFTCSLAEGSPITSNYKAVQVILYDLDVYLGVGAIHVKLRWGLN